MVYHGIWNGRNWNVSNYDANHGAYSKNKKVNNFFGFFITFLGGNYINWRIQHNVLHHTYTNISGMDEDLESDPLMRF